MKQLGQTFNVFSWTESPQLFMVLECKTVTLVKKYIATTHDIISSSSEFDRIGPKHSLIKLSIGKNYLGPSRYQLTKNI